MAATAPNDARREQGHEPANEESGERSERVARVYHRPARDVVAAGHFDHAQRHQGGENQRHEQDGKTPTARACGQRRRQREDAGPDHVVEGQRDDVGPPQTTEEFCGILAPGWFPLASSQRLLCFDTSCARRSITQEKSRAGDCPTTASRSPYGVSSGVNDRRVRSASLEAPRAVPLSNPCNFVNLQSAICNLQSAICNLQSAFPLVTNRA